MLSTCLVGFAGANPLGEVSSALGTHAIYLYIRSEERFSVSNHLQQECFWSETQIKT